MPLDSLLTADRILAAVETDHRDAVLEVAARLLAGGDASQAPAIADSLRQRERLGSTAIGHGIAIPHGRSNILAEPRGAFLRLDPPIEFGATDGEAVDLVFALIVPEHFTQQHLQLLSELAERFADASFRAALREADDATGLYHLLAGNAPAQPIAARSGAGRS